MAEEKTEQEVRSKKQKASATTEAETVQPTTQAPPPQQPAQQPAQPAQPAQTQQPQQSGMSSGAKWGLGIGGCCCCLVVLIILITFLFGFRGTCNPMIFQGLF